METIILDGPSATPLPQRQQRGNNPANKVIGKHTAPKQSDGPDGSPAEKKPRFGGSNNQNGGPAGGGAVGGGQNQNKNFGNKGGFGGNRNRNRGGNQNRQNFQGPNNANQKSTTNEAVKPDAGNVAEKVNESVAVIQQPAPNANQGPGPGQGQGQGSFRGGPRGGGGGGVGNNQGGGGGGGGGSNHPGGGGGGNHPGGGNNHLGGGGHHPGGGGGGQQQQRDRGNRGGGGQRSGGGQGGPNMSMMGGGPRGGGGGGGGDDFFIGQRLRAITGPTLELPPVEVPEETKFSGRNRLYVGNLTGDITDNELREMFKPFGEIGEIFSNIEKNFTFLKVDYHVNAEKAKRALDGSLRKGRQLRVRFAPNATILRVSNLTPFVSNELLYKSFEIFGPLERASITVDDRGKHTGEGIVEFAKKSSASACLRLCNEKCFFLTASLRPCLVEPMEVNDDNDGLPEKALNKKLQDFNQERCVGPRFADLNSFEHEYGSRWKQLHDLYKSKQDALKRELKMEEDKLEAQMEYARYEQETELLRQELRKREVDNERKKMEWEMREKQAEDMRKRDEDTMRRHQSEMQTRMVRQEEDMRRRQQENTLFIQAQQLNSLLDQQEGCGSGGGNNSSFDNFGGSSSPFEVFRGNNNNSTMTGNNSGPGGPNKQENQRNRHHHHPYGSVPDVTAWQHLPWVLDEVAAYLFWNTFVKHFYDSCKMKMSIASPCFIKELIRYLTKTKKLCEFVYLFDNW
ncbi:protein no-on-transient A isoform X1 [Drosophila miranda]|uniref:protein no-on-transient A isoform X1 n=1 Tax=Drosophila miranda TaxID=7229 RepID=UPI00143F0CD1|nr:protein no-on-transient A isoform X1 [Drosophila miranda]